MGDTVPDQAPKALTMITGERLFTQRLLISNDLQPAVGWVEHSEAQQTVQIEHCAAPLGFAALRLNPTYGQQKTINLRLIRLAERYC